MAVPNVELNIKVLRMMRVFFPPETCCKIIYDVVYHIDAGTRADELPDKSAYGEREYQAFIELWLEARKRADGYEKRAEKFRYYNPRKKTEEENKETNN